MRNSPTPSRSRAPASSASLTPPMLASSATWCPSRVVPGPLVPARAAARLSRRTFCSSTMEGSGLIVTSPESPSRATNVPAGMPVAPLSWTTAGMPIWAARIAVWLVRPPSWVTMPTTRARSSVAVSAGARSSATMTLGSLKSGTPGAGTPSTAATAREPTSRRSVTRSAKYPPSASNWAQYSSTALAMAFARPRPASSCLPAALTRPLSRAMSAVALRICWAVSSACLALPSRATATDSKAALTSVSAASRSCAGGSSAGGRTGGETCTTGPYADPGLTPMPCRVSVAVTSVTPRRGRARGGPRGCRGPRRPRRPQRSARSPRRAWRPAP